MLLFDPKIQVHVYLDDEFGARKYILNDPERNVDQDIPEDDLHIEFSVLSTDKPEPNSADITIYNLSKQTRNFFSSDHQGVEVYAGYGEEIKMIFRGVTTNVSHERAGADWITKIYAYDGLDALIDPKNKFNRSYKKGVKVSTVIKQIIKQLGIDAATDLSLLTDRTPYAVVYSGVIKTVLNQIAIDYDLEWSIQRGVLYIYNNDPESRFFAKQVATVLTANTGMIGSPALTERTEQVKKKRKKNAPPQRIPGVRVTSLLNPDLTPGSLMEIKSIAESLEIGSPNTEKALSTDADGIYFIKSSRFYGNNYGGEFYVTAEADVI